MIEVNRDLTVDQIAMLDETLKKLGLSKATRVTLHDQQPRRVRPSRAMIPKAQEGTLPANDPPEAKPPSP